MELLKKIEKDVIAAMRAKDKFRLTVLRSLKAAAKYETIDSGKELDDEMLLTLLKKQVKSRQQAIELFKQGNRDELVEKENREIEIINEYLPKPMSEDEILKAVLAVIKEQSATSMKDMGLVMKSLKTSLGSKADGKILSNLVRRELNK